MSQVPRFSRTVNKLSGLSDQQTRMFIAHRLRDMACKKIRHQLVFLVFGGASFFSVTIRGFLPVCFKFVQHLGSTDMLANRTFGDPASQLHERHDASDFDT